MNLNGLKIVSFYIHGRKKTFTNIYNTNDLSLTIYIYIYIRKEMQIRKAHKNVRCSNAIIIGDKKPHQQYLWRESILM